VHDEDGRILLHDVHRCQLVRIDDAVLQSLQRLLDEDDELLHDHLHVSLKEKKKEQQRRWRAVKKKSKKKSNR